MSSSVSMQGTVPLVVRPVLLYLVVVAGAALSSRFTRGSEPALLAWLGATLLLLVRLFRIAYQGSAFQGPHWRSVSISASLVVVAAVTGFVGIVLMVTVWEFMGLGYEGRDYDPDVHDCSC